MIEQAVTPGIDVFIDRAKERNARVGLVTNPSGVTSQGVPSWRALVDGGYNLRALFGPEHGFSGEAQDAASVGDGTFEGVQVHSLYGERQRPTPEMLNNLDVVVYDIQDVGCRYYTFLYTLAYTMEECQKLGKRVVVLDRPNPIGAEAVEGGPIPGDAVSFVGGYRLPARYGLTVGEYALYLQGEFLPDIDLCIVWMEGYRRAMPYRDTGLPWTLPSPNLPSVATAYAYPGTCLFEGTNLSEGRGTTRPFELIGAPWLDAEAFRRTLMAEDLPGVVFTSASFRPTFSKHMGEVCQGVLVNVTDRNGFRPLNAAVAMLVALKREFPEQFDWKKDWQGNGSFVDRLAGGTYMRDMVDAGKSVSDVYRRATQGQETFLGIRERYLHYPV